ncbi:MAG: DedA family protein [Pseudomonadota bacterium]
MIDYLIRLVEEAPPGIAFAGVIVVLLICGLGAPFPEEIPLILAGYLVYTGEVSLQTCLIGTFVALLVGDSLLFVIGFRLGPRIFKIPLFRKLLTPDRVKKVSDRFHRYGNRVVFVARFMAGVRGTVFVTAGILKMPYRRFILFDGLAALISAPLIIYIAYHFGSEIDSAAKVAREAGWLLFTIAGILAIGISILVVRIRRHRRAAHLAIAEKDPLKLISQNKL